MSPNAPITRRDGTIIRRKEQMTKAYDESYLPWPLNPIFNLDYCWRVNFLMWKHACVMAIPATGIHFMWTNPNFKGMMTWKTFPKLLTAINYVAAVLLISSANSVFSLLSDDYW